ncbi:MAG TPA: glycosyltransferase [Gemmatimonadales bacterium]|nr:glycosyltransferase [Gemmatimonadales bacterium]
MIRRRVLLVSYHFPPVGGAGVQRPAKLAKYLPRFGWDVSVLQAANPSVPLLDPSLLEDLPDDLVIVKARTLEPGYAAKSATAGPPGGSSSSRLKRIVRSLATMALQPDAQVLWLPAARRAGLDLLARQPHDAILATAPTYTNLVLGGMLARRTGLPLVLDYRDEWDISSAYWENAPRDPISPRVQQWMQRRVLRASRAIVATTAASTARIAARAADAGVFPLARCIYNGWDPSDIQQVDGVAPAVPRDPTRHRIVYAGTLWALTSIAPVVEALLALARETPRLVERLELVVLGRKTPEQEQELARLAGTAVTLHTPAYVPHAVALATMRSADTLLLLLSDVPGAERVAPAKLFEYLALGQPMLAVTPAGETADLVRAAQPDAWRSPRDIPGIVAWFRTRLDPNIGGGSTTGTPPDYAARFTRHALAGEMAGVLDTVTRKDAP